MVFLSIFWSLTSSLMQVLPLCVSLPRTVISENIGDLKGWRQRWIFSPFFSDCLRMYWMAEIGSCVFANLNR